MRKFDSFELKTTRMILLVAGLVFVAESNRRRRSDIIRSMSPTSIQHVTSTSNRAGGNQGPFSPTPNRGGGGAELGEVDSCDSAQLKECVALIPRTHVGLPRTKEELDAHCQAFQTGMSCMDKWIKRCLPTDGQKFLQQQIGGARALMQFLCTNETALRKEFLREPMCWSRVSPDWTQCVDQLQDAVREIRERAQQLTYFDRNAELCCARDAFMMCVTEAGRTCTAAASTLLKRMAWVLAQDVAACTHHPRAYCSAPAPPRAAPMLTALFGIVFYPPNF